MTRNTAENSLYDEIVEFSESYEENRNNAMEKFKYYQEKGIIFTCSFHDNKWSISDQYNNSSFIFRFSKTSYYRYYQEIFNISLDDFIVNVKIYLVLMMGKLVISSLRDILNDVKLLIRSDYSLINQGQIMFNRPHQLIELISSLIISDLHYGNKLIEYLENYVDNMYVSTDINRRKLSSFESYFKFNDYLFQYWSTDMSEQERLFYYPIYLWWSITGIIPLRPREFILTPRDCLKVKNDQKHIVLRRNCLKGGGQDIQYNIEKDYIKVMYPITNRLWNDISKYISLTNNHEANTIDTLFRTEPHYAMFNQTKRYDSRFYTYVNLRTCLERFYVNVLSHKMRLNIIMDSATSMNLTKDDIEYINLGDTRHIAMINIIAEGGNPSIAMQLAGHTSIDMSSHYYANISNLIECKTYMKYRKLLTDKSDYQMGTSFYPSIDNISYIEIEDGAKCYSPNFIKGDLSDCEIALGLNSEIGLCTECQYYSKTNQGFFISDENIYKSNIEKDCTLLKISLNNYRKGIGYEEDIQSALLKLEYSSNKYHRYCFNKLLHSDRRKDDNGKV